MTFDELYKKATSVLYPRKLSEYAEAGGVGAAILTENENVYMGVCIDTACSMGFCAEHAAAAAIVEWTQKHIEVFGEKDPFRRENFVSKRVVRDENIITAQGIAFIDFAIEICDWFKLFETQEDRDNFAKSIKGI